jgi:hypothetical protein
MGTTERPPTADSREVLSPLHFAEVKLHAANDTMDSLLARVEQGKVTTGEVEDTVQAINVLVMLSIGSSCMGILEILEKHYGTEPSTEHP